mmetsp:Transcript_10083/g.27581  ORF Transcript_10083/g.27581 Transcript_10083/m.27581 type:complete len:126 (+) Transcript_10083:1283-1660(+)
MVRSAPCNTNIMPQTSTLPIIPAHPARAQHQFTDARKLYQQSASGIHTRKLTSTGVVQGRVRHQKTTMNVRDLSHPANLGVQIATKQHMRGDLSDTRNLIKERRERVSHCSHRKRLTNWVDVQRP